MTEHKSFKRLVRTRMRSHREIARWVAAKQGVVPLAWNAQAVAGSYELARSLRVVGEKPDGFAVTATKAKSARFDWGEGDSRVSVTFLAKGETKSTAALEHRRLADADEAERMKAYWRQRIAALKEVLER